MTAMPGGKGGACGVAGCDYTAFLQQKIRMANFKGFDIQPAAVHEVLFPHQRDIVRWAVLGGNRAIFASFGLGKSVMQCEWLRQVIGAAGGRGLIVCPLGVRQELIRDAAMLGVQLVFIRSASEMTDRHAFYVTNYETVRDGKLDPALFTAVSLDEASVLRSFGSKTYQEFLPLFEGVRFKLVNTATPSPNRFKELIHYAGFLGVMDTGQALTRFFQRDSEKAGNLTLYPHKEQEFWLWVSSWAVFVQRPSDLGHSDAGYDLPPIEVRYHEVPTDYAKAGADRDGQALMFTDPALGLSAAAAEKRDSLPRRIEQFGEIVDAYVGSCSQGRVCEGVLPKEPRSAAEQAEGKGRGGRSGAAGRVPAPVPRGEQGGPAGEAASEGPAELRGEQASASRTAAPHQAEEVRDQRGAEGGAAAVAGTPVPDLRAFPCGADGAIDRPLPCHGVSQGNSLPALQLGSGPVRGEPGDAGAGVRVPGHSTPAASDQIVVWCDLNAEQDAIERALAERGLTFSSVHGALTTEEAERRIQEWRDRKTYALIGKPVMLGQGMNLQQCNKAIFVGVTYKFNDLIQAVHRIQRYGQKRVCDIHIVYSEAEREVLRTLQQKWAQHEEMVTNMTEIIKRYGLNQLAMQETLARSIGVERIEVSGDLFTVANNDCVEEAKRQAEASVDLIVTSIPFANHYEYSPSYNDFGHTDDNAHFWSQMDFLTPELLRILKPGRLYCCHVKDRILFGNVTGAGAPTVSPFHCEAIMHGRKHGFDYMGLITVVTDVVRENNQTYRLGWSEQCKDGTKMGVGSPEYIVLFRKPQTDRAKGYADVPVRKSKDEYTRAHWQVDAHAFWRSSGNRQITAEELAGLGPDKLASLFTKYSLQQVYDYEFHIRIGEELEARGALPSTFMSLAPGSHHPDVWHDVTRMLTLNSEQSRRAVEKHVCPLQFDIVDRLIERYSNKGELVYDPFCGLGTVPYRAILKGRLGGGSELNSAYFMDQVHYLRSAEQQVSMPSLFDALEEAAA
jgi:SAM-dependent methyltransferase